MNMRDSIPGFDHGPDYAMPAREDLLDRLRFSPETGNIWLDAKRMFLLHVEAFGTLRRELIETVGIERARGMLTRMGYQSGSRDAEMAKKVRADLTYFERFSVGPQLHALEGIVLVEPVRVEIDVEKGQYYGEFIWRDSIEDEAHMSAYRLGAEAACWMQIGYACGYTSAFLGRSVLYREVECRARGSEHCRIIGKPVEEWKDAEDDLRYFKAQPFVNQVIADRSLTLEGASRPASALRTTGKSNRHGQRTLIGASAGFNMVCHSISRVASTDAPVLLLGESGVGKEMFARALQANGPRSNSPFITVNCAAIPDQLIESELFGVEKGAYTGANASRPGRFERANGGTLFLDEVGCLSLSAQSKLLRVLQEGELERVGDSRARQVDVRIVAATNEDLRDCIKKKTFREDLYYRLNVYPIQIPPLRERTEDISILMEYFLERHSTRHQRKITGFTDQAIDALLSYPWPGNVRELENMIERAVILAPEGGAIDIIHLAEILGAPARPARPAIPSSGTGLSPTIASTPTLLEDWAHQDDSLGTGSKTTTDSLRDALNRHSGNVCAVARELGATRAQIAYRARKQGLADLLRRRS